MIIMEVYLLHIMINEILLAIRNWMKNANLVFAEHGYTSGQILELPRFNHSLNILGGNI